MAEACTHHWRIEIPEGPTSAGVCRRCGLERLFPNTEEAALEMKSIPQSRNWREMAADKRASV